MSFRPRKNHPYAHAARLPEGSEPLAIASLMPGDGPVEIEIGCGRGGFLFERAVSAPDARLLGLEIRLKWSHLVDDRLREAGLSARARVFAEDARQALPRLTPDACVRAVFLHFPDPWWKRRHEKRLVMAPELLVEVRRLLIPGGELYVQTDVEERALLYREQIEASDLFELAGDEPGSPLVADNPYGARSPRERRAIKDGLPVLRMRYRSPGAE